VRTTKNSIIAGGIAPGRQSLPVGARIAPRRFSINAPAVALGLNRTLAPLMSKSTLNYSARNACMGLILLARLAGSHAAARVVTTTAAIAVVMAAGSGDRGLAGELGTIHSRDSCIGRGLPAKIVKEGIREELPAATRDREGEALGPAVTKQDKFARILDRQRSQKNGICQRKNGRVGSDSQRQ